jgi:hypothetical protein
MNLPTARHGKLWIRFEKAVTIDIPMTTPAASSGLRPVKLKTPQQLASFAILDSKAATPEANGLIDYLLPVIESHEMVSGARTRRRIAKLGDLRVALESFLGDLLGAESNTKSEGWIYRSMERQAFTGGHVSYRNFSCLVVSLMGLGYVEKVAGGRFYVANGFDPSAPPALTEGVSSRFRASQTLCQLAESFGVSASNARWHFPENLPEQLIWLKSRSRPDGRKTVEGKLMDFKPSDVVQLEAAVREINTFLDKFDIRGGRHRGYHRSFNLAYPPFTHTY